MEYTISRPAEQEALSNKDLKIGNFPLTPPSKNSRIEVEKF